MDLVEGSDLTEATAAAAVDTGSFLISVVPVEAVSAARMASATISFFLLTGGADEVFIKGEEFSNNFTMMKLGMRSN